MAKCFIVGNNNAKTDYDQGRGDPDSKIKTVSHPRNPKRCMEIETRNII